MKSYRYIDGEFAFESEIKRSRFIATVKGELNSQEAEEFVKSVRKKFPDATHNCYAYVADELGNETRYSDDGEPSGTAGQPILDVLKKRGLKMTAIVVTRYFGGVKLGAGGLVGAYSGAAAEAVANAVQAEKVECLRVDVKADYNSFAAVENALKAMGLAFETPEYGEYVRASAYVPVDETDTFTRTVNEFSAGRAEIKIDSLPKFKKIQLKEI